MDSEKIVISILSAFSPILFTYLFKQFENKRQTSVRLHILDEAQKRISFLNTYFQTQNAFGETTDLGSLKSKLATEALAIKTEVEIAYQVGIERAGRQLGTVQKLFLTFKPLSVLGWLWHMLFYLTLTTTTFSLLGMCIDEVNNEYTLDAFIKSINDSELMIGLLTFVAMLMLFRWLAISNFKSRSRSAN
jgi:hypothetical protein